MGYYLICLISLFNSFQNFCGHLSAKKGCEEMERESDVEHYFVNKCKKFGYLTYKFVSPGEAGVPDRIAISDRGLLSFIEFKRNTAEYPRPLQFKQMHRLKDAGQTICVLRSKREVEWFFTWDGDIPVYWEDLEEEAQSES